MAAVAADVLVANDVDVANGANGLGDQPHLREGK